MTAIVVLNLTPSMAVSSSAAVRSSKPSAISATPPFRPQSAWRGQIVVDGFRHMADADVACESSGDLAYGIDDIVAAEVTT